MIGENAPMSTKLLGALLLVSIACGTSRPAPAPAPQASAPPEVARPPAPAKPAPAAPDPDAAQSLEWLVATIESGGKVTKEEIEARFAPEFLAQVPADQVATLLAALAAQLPPIKVVEQGVKSPVALSALVETKAGGMRVTIGMTDKAPRKMHTLFFKPASTEPPPASYAEVIERLKASGTDSQLYVAEIRKNRCVPSVQHEATRRLAIGSTFKLWVLLALEGKLHGKITWDSTIPVKDELKSLPSGVVQNQPAGTALPVREYANKMISISDNTATDHLIDFVGRKGVEQALRRSRHGKPALNTPFFTTRDLFALKLAATSAERDAYRKAPVAAKRTMLVELEKKPLDIAMATGWDGPRDLDLEWFADARDLCQVYVELGKAAQWKPESDLLSVLAINPGVPVDKADWPYLGFKGGSEPGVINLSWLARRADGRWFVVVATVNDKTKSLDDGRISNAAAGALTLLGKEK